VMRFGTWTGFVCLGLLAGCGGDSDDAAPTVDTGIDETKALSDVTESEARQACEHMRDAMRDVINTDTLVPSFCTLFALGPATSEASCNDMRDECIREANADPDVQMGGEIDFECDGDTSEFVGCDVSVGVLETCINDSLAGMNAALHRYSCRDAERLSSEDVEALDPFAFETPGSCQPLEDQCDGAGVITNQM
jgi:hypothetical protein